MRILVLIVVLQVVLTVVPASYGRELKGHPRDRRRSCGGRHPRNRLCSRKYPKGFTFGAAIDPYGYEGGWDADNKAPSIWDNGTHTIAGLTVDNSTGDVAADSYHRWPRDVQCLKDIKAQHYSFGIQWSRILPDCWKDTPNPAAVDYYNGLIDSLCQNGIEPVVALSGYDLPEMIQRIGGCTNGDLIALFELYADVCFKLFGDRVKKWITFDWPNAFANLFYGNPNLWPVVQPIPGIAEYKCSNNILKAHACAYRLYQKRYVKRFHGKVGIGLVSRFFVPNPDNGTLADVEKALDFDLGWFLNPICGEKCGYPSSMLKSVAQLSKAQGYTVSRLKDFSPRWKKKICRSADFVALFYSSSSLVRWTPTPEPYTTGYGELFYTPDAELEYTDNPNWKRGPFYSWYAEGLRGLLNFMKEKYNCPIFIYGNGLSTEGGLHDPDRIEYFDAHLEQLELAIFEDKVNVCGYTAWALLDGFEYDSGYTWKSGLFETNFTSLEATPRASASWYRNYIQSCKP